MNKLIKLSILLEKFEQSNFILSLAARYDKVLDSKPKLQPAYKYIMYLKLIRNLDDSSFHAAKRKYLNTSRDIQKECENELDKMILEDSSRLNLSTVQIRSIFAERLNRFENQGKLEEYNIK